MFLYPPRPEKAISPSLIKSFENRGYIAQLKKNGTCTVISIDDSGVVSWYTRHGEAHKGWTPTPELTEYFSFFNNSVFVGELLHSKGPSVKNTIYLFDILRFTGINMVGMSLRTRLEAVAKLENERVKVQVPLTFVKNLTDIYQSLTDPLDEGIVLKDPNAILRSCERDGLNAAWQVKCRRSTKNFSF